MKNKIIDTLNIVEGKPILNLVVLAISLFISLCMATVIVSAVRFVIAVPIAILSSEPAPNHILVQSESNALYLMDMKTKKETSLALNADFNSEVIGVVKKGEVFTIVDQQNGLYQFKSGAGWISAATKYVQKI